MRKIAFYFFAFSLALGPAFAAESSPRPVSVRLISETDSLQPGNPLWLGLEIKTAKGVHVYWKNPGDSGAATKAKWTLPDGFSSVSLQWPFPRKFTDSAGTTYGYSGETLLLARVDAPETLAQLPEGTTVSFGVRVDWLECSSVCAPGRADLSLTLPVRPASGRRNSVLSRRFSDARLKLPLILEDTGWKVQAFRRHRRIRLELTPPPSFKTELAGLSFFPENQSLVDTSEPERFSRSDGRYVLEFPYSQLASVSPSSVEGVIVSRQGWRGPGSSRALAVNIRIE
jgi:thiol:disulfide interchange protein DsbD